jgi:RNA binding exosome subunit
VVLSGFFGGSYARMAYLDSNFPLAHVQVMSDGDSKLVFEVSRGLAPRLYLRRPPTNKCELAGAVRRLPLHPVVQSVQISTIAHATDDLDKVQAALRFILPESLKQKQVFTRRYMQGHHGNPIVTFEAKLAKPQEVDQVTHHFIGQLAKNEKLLIERDLDTHSDDQGNLYIRIDKQQAFRGVVELGDEDPIRLRLKFSRLSEEPRELMKKLLESK